MADGKKILFGCSSAIEGFQLAKLIDSLHEYSNSSACIKVILTKRARHYCNEEEVRKRAEVFVDEDEWQWQKRGDPVLHIELAKWADVFLLSPIDGSSIAKVAEGFCDNLLMSAVRAWDKSKPLLIIPSMNSVMWVQPVTNHCIQDVKSHGFQHLHIANNTTSQKDLLKAVKGFLATCK